MSKVTLANATILASEKHDEGRKYDVGNAPYNLLLSPMGIRLDQVSGNWYFVVDKKKKEVAQAGQDVEITGCKNIEITLLHKSLDDSRVSFRMTFMSEEDYDSLQGIKSEKETLLAVYQPPTEAKMLNDKTWSGITWGHTQVKMPMVEINEMFSLHKKVLIEFNYMLNEMPDCAEATNDLKELLANLGLD